MFVLVLCGLFAAKFEGGGSVKRQSRASVLQVRIGSKLACCACCAVAAAIEISKRRVWPESSMDTQAWY